MLLNNVNSTKRCATSLVHFTSPALSHVSCTGPMHCPKGCQVSCATLADWAADSNAPVQLVYESIVVVLCVCVVLLCYLYSVEVRPHIPDASGARSSQERQRCSMELGGKEGYLETLYQCI